MTRLEENPFHVLGVPTDAAPVEVERAGQKLLAMLAVGLEAAQTYRTPLGPRTRDADLVRRALDELRDPDRRLLHEVWAALPPEELAPEPDLLEPWPEALQALGWERPGRTR